MATLIVSNDGLFLIEKQDLEELGIKPSDQIKVQLQPNGQATWKTEDRPPKRTLTWEEVAGSLHGLTQENSSGSWEEIFGMFEGQIERVATLKDISEASGPEWNG